jgi:hypothetical protein
MPQMVYLRQINPHSFMVFSTKKEGFCLRDFSAAGNGPPQKIMKQSGERKTSAIRTLASQEGNYSIEVVERPLSDYRYWHEQTMKLNQHYLKSRPNGAPLVQPKPQTWTRQIIVGVIVAVIAGVILAWLGMK